MDSGATFYECRKWGKSLGWILEWTMQVDAGVDAEVNCGVDSEVDSGAIFYMNLESGVRFWTTVKHFEGSIPRI